MSTRSYPNYNSTGNSGSNNFTDLQTQVDEVKGVMTQNIDKILQRGDKLEDLVDKTTELESSAIQFNVQAKRVKRKMWWKNLKMMLILGLVILIILTIIIVALVLKLKPSKTPDTPATTPYITTTIFSSTITG